MQANPPPVPPPVSTQAPDQPPPERAIFGKGKLAGGLTRVQGSSICTNQKQGRGNMGTHQITSPSHRKLVKATATMTRRPPSLRPACVPAREAQTKNKSNKKRLSKKKTHRHTDLLQRTLVQHRLTDRQALCAPVRRHWGVKAHPAQAACTRRMQAARRGRQKREGPLFRSVTCQKCFIHHIKLLR